MIRTIPILPLVLAGALGLGLAACSSGPNVAGTAPPATPAAPADIEAIAGLLDRGQVGEARSRLNAALRDDPMNPSLLVLRQGMYGDAKADLGPASYGYTVAAGDTMAGLAERLLGNRLKSYQLARYNDIDNPSDLAAGQVLRIPGQAARAGSDRGGETQRPASAASAPARPRAAASSAPRPAPRTADAAGAQRARTAGLAALNKGDVDVAVAQLQRAAALDPDNAAIERDLARARRIAGTVRSRQ